MASSNGAPPSANALQAGVSSSGTLNANAPSNTQIIPPEAGPSGPTGPTEAGVNPGENPAVPLPTLPDLGSAPPATLPPDIASQFIPGDEQTVGATKPSPAKEFSDKQIVSELAKVLKVKESKDVPLEVAVADALAKKYHVPLNHNIETWRGTGDKQGEVGKVRHDIVSWWNDASRDLGTAISGTVHGKGLLPKLHNPEDEQQKYQDATKIKNSQLREKAIESLAGRTPISQFKRQMQDQTDVQQPEQIESKNALNAMLNQVAERLGANAQSLGPGGENALADIAQNPQINVPTGTPASPGSPGTQQTAGQAYAAFAKQAFNANGTLTTWGGGQVQQLENAGFLNKSYGNTTAGPPANAVAQAYANVITNAVQNKQSVNAAMAAGPTPAQSTGATSPSAAQSSEMTAFVQGVGTEFGVYLTPQQVTKIANQFEPGAIVATGQTTGSIQPGDVEDQIKDAVVQLYDPSNPNNPPGVANTMFTDIQQQALAYQIPISKAQIGQMVQKAMQGATIESMYVAADAAMSNAQEQFEQQAQGLYPSLAPQIKQGQTVANLVAPYFTVAEQYTGVPSAEMMADNQTGGLSKWSNFLNAKNAPSGTIAPNTSGSTKAAGEGPQMMTLDQWKQELMKNPVYGFDKTQGAKDMAEELGAAILNEFGKVNTGGPEQALNSYNPQQALQANT